MKKLFILLLVLPLFTIAQKTKMKQNSTSAVPHKSVNGFLITGIVTGFKDGTSVSFLNEQTGQPEKQSTIQNGKFFIKGKMAQPGFKGLIFENMQPLVPIFLDNSEVKIVGDKTALDKMQITGSPSHEQFMEYTNALKPYEKIFVPDAAPDSVAMNKVGSISEDFVRKYPSSYVSPLAIIRLYQVTENGFSTAAVYNCSKNKDEAKLNICSTA
jgi:hypothetical protein